MLEKCYAMRDELGTTQPASDNIPTILCLYSIAGIALIEDRVKAIREKGVGALISSHAPDVGMFDALDPLRSVGADVVRERAKQWFAWYQGAITRFVISASRRVKGWPSAIISTG